MSEPKTPTPTPAGDTYKGWVFKWTNYIKGYQRRWFVLSNGLLSYYRYALLQNTDKTKEGFDHVTREINFLCIDIL